MSTSAVWTEQRTHQLITYLDNGMTRTRAAELLGITRNAAIGRAWRIGYKKTGCKYKFRQRKAALQALIDEAMLCKIRNNGCRPAVVVRNHSTKCKSPECSNTRLPGYLHGLCSQCNTTRLNQRRRA